MFADYVKMAAKGVALGIGVASIIGFLVGFTIPVLDLSQVGTFINTAYSIGSHYIPFFQTLWTLGVSLITLSVTLYGVKIALIAVKWVLKINE